MRKLNHSFCGLLGFSLLLLTASGGKAPGRTGPALPAGQLSAPRRPVKDILSATEAHPNSTAPAGGSAVSMSKPDAAVQRRVVQSYGRLPLSFEANQGQTDARVKFLSRGAGYVLFLTGSEAVLALKKPEAGSQKPRERSQEPGARSQRPGEDHRVAVRSALPVAGHLHGMSSPGQAAKDNGPRTKDAVLTMRLVGANPKAPVSGTDELPGKSNYFIGSDPKKWRTNVPTYAKVKSEDVYPGVDLVYYGNQGQLEYDFVVAPGADPRAIRLALDSSGSRQKAVGGRPSETRRPDPKPRLDANGDLIVRIDSGQVRFRKPAVYQPSRTPNPESRTPIEGHYKLIRQNRVTFELGSYDRNRPLVIDPTVNYSTYLGGSSYDSGEGIAADSSGNAYVVGYTASTDFPVTAGAFQTTCGGACITNAFVTKLNPSGSSLIYSTYLGGSGGDVGIGIAVDGTGDAYITGEAFSVDFPTTPGAFQTTCPSCAQGWSDAFVTELNPTGSALLYSTYLGGSGPDKGYGIAVDSAGDAYVGGYTFSSDFPTTPDAFQTAYGGAGEAFVTELNQTGSSLLYSTFFNGGGGNNDYVAGIAVDSTGDAFVTGYTGPGLPTTPGAFQTTYPPTTGSSGFVTKFNPSGSGLTYSTYLGATTSSAGNGIAVDAAGDAFVVGATDSGFPVTPGAFQTTFGGGDGDGFLTKLNPSGSSLIYSTYLGGSDGEQAYGVQVAASGAASVSGETSSTNFPTTPGAFQTAYGGDEDAFATEFNPAGSALIYSTYLGGSGAEFGTGVAVDLSGDSYFTGWTPSTDFPTTPGAFQTTCGGGCSGDNSDAFVFKLVASPNAAPSPSSISFASQVVGTTSPGQNVTLTNTGDAILSISAISIGGSNAGDFAQTNTCGTSLSVWASCMITVTFTPSASGTRAAEVEITDNASGSPQSVSLSGTGVLPTVTLSPASLNFGMQLPGTTSSPQTVTLSVNGPLTITSISTTGPFAQTNNCGSGLGTAGDCSINVTFTPTGLGTQNGSLMVSDTGAGSPQSVSLTGNGVQPAVKLSPTSLTFPTEVVFTRSQSQAVTLSNSGTGTLTITSVTVTAQFVETNTCGTSVAPGGSCTIYVSFGPRNKGTVTGTLSVTDNAPGSPQTVSLRGSGTYLELSPESINFGSQPVGTTSLPRRVTLTNKGGSAVSISGISISGNDPGDFARSNHCGSSLASGASCLITLTFTPTAQGKRTADVSITDNGGGSPQTVSLTGTGTD
jgi:hypothetical protein